MRPKIANQLPPNPNNIIVMGSTQQDATTKADADPK